MSGHGCFVSSRLTRFLALVGWISASTCLYAVTETWDGGGANDDWSTGNNWADNTAPASATTLDIIFDGSVRLTPNAQAAYSLNTITFNAGAGAFVVSGGALTLNNANAAITQTSNSAQTINNALILNRNTDIEGAGAGMLTLAGDISEIGGARTITKTGTYSAVFSGNNSYTGTTVISVGVLNIRSASGLGSTGAGTTVADGAALELQGGITIGAETLLIKGSGVGGNGALRSISGNNTYGGVVTINTTTTIQSDTVGNKLTLSDSIIGSNDILILQGAGDGETLGAISIGTQGITKNGSGTWTLSGTAANDFTGGSIVNSGELALNKTAGVDAISGALTIGDGVGTDTVKLMAAEQINNASAVTVQSSGILNLNNQSETIGSLAGAGTVQFGGGGTANTLTVGNASNSDFSGVINGTSDTTDQLIKVGVGILTLSGAAANTFTGITTVNTGELDLNKSTGVDAIAGNLTIGDGVGADTVKLLAADQINNSSAVTINSSGVFNLNNMNETFASVEGSGVIQFGSGGANTLTLGDGNNKTFSGAINSTSDATDQITKQGSGSLTLTGLNTFSGKVVVNAGSLELQVGNALSGMASMTLDVGGTLLLSVSNTMNDSGNLLLSGGTLTSDSITETLGSLSLTANSVINLGEGAAAGNLTFSTGSVVGGAILTINNWHGDNYSDGTDDQIVFGSDPGATFLDQVQFAGYEPGAFWNSTTGRISPVPEPGTIGAGLALLALLGFKSYRRRFRYGF